MSPVELLERAGTPRLLRMPARILFSSSLVGALVLALAPWRQTAHGDGRVIPYSPVDREQRIDAPVGGRLVRWLVAEGDVVKAGDPIVELVDVDEDYLHRLEQKRAAIFDQLEAAEARVTAYETQSAAYEDVRRMRIKAAVLDVDMAQQKLVASLERQRAVEAALDTAQRNAKRVADLHGEGFVSRRELELAELKVAEEETKVNAARAAVAEARSYVQASRANRLRAESEASATVASAEAERRKAHAEAAKAKEERAKIEVDISRQRAQLVTAPRAGTLLWLNHVVTGGVIKSGESLALLVPSGARQAAELWIDGNDVPLIKKGREVRLQFEGWPAVQFSGWPNVAVGTFRGSVLFIDPAGREDGRFRIMVVPAEPWPGREHLRQGVRVKGWVLLDEVRLGFEVWRQVNGFPPALESDGEAMEH